MSTEEAERAGRLLLVATPIGNLQDLSERARAALAAADLVACEDTRRTGRLLQHLGLERRLLSLHEHNEQRRVEPLVERIEAGETVALVSDAGTPLVSDPGYLLVRACIEGELPVEAIPGPSAVTTALVASGLPPQPFTFLGFLPPKSGRRRRALLTWADQRHTLVWFESPHRIVASLADAAEVLGEERPAAIARELTKLHEEIVTAPLGELARRFGGDVRGEVVVVVGPSAAATSVADEEISLALGQLAADGATRRDASAAVAADLRVAKRRVYDLAVAMEWPTG